MGLVNLVKNAVFASALASCTVYGGLEKEVDKRQVFTPDDFSSSPFVSVTQVYSVPDAKTTLIHIRQMHVTSNSLENDIIKDYSEDRKREFRLGRLGDYAIINNVQREIYSFLDNLRNSSVNEVWAEGFVNSFFEFNAGVEYNAVLRELYKKGLFVEEIDSGKLDSCKFIPGADLLLGMIGHYNILPGEDFFLNERAILSVKAGTGVYQSVFKDREDYMIKRIVDSGKPFGFFIFGGGHNFMDNIIDWNNTNTNRKVSFIEVTPRSFPVELSNKN